MKRKTFSTLTIIFNLIFCNSSFALWSNCFEDAGDDDNLVHHSYAEAVDLAYSPGGGFEAVWIDAKWQGSQDSDAAQILPFDSTGSTPILQGGWGKITEIWDSIEGYSAPGTGWDGFSGEVDYDDWDPVFFHASWKVEWDDGCIWWNQP